MKHAVVIFLLSCWPALAIGQLVNPTVIYQDTDIALHHTDVYYSPFAPPAPTDTRIELSCIGSMDSNGLTHDYYPRTHGMPLNLWHPCVDSLGDSILIGNQVPWQRLFCAMDKPGGAHSDIIAGGDTGERVVISKNEDVDFRATGRIKLKSGFHVRAGAFFHAYTAPKFDTAVFSDEFDDTAKFHNQWTVYNNTYAGPAQGPDCSFDSNIALVTDVEAFDNHALRIDLKEDTCLCQKVSRTSSDCAPVTLDITYKSYQFSTALILSCPFPFDRGTDPISTAYQNAPYGKWEIREKVPIIEHHTNTYGSGQGNEWNLGEKLNGGLYEIHPGFTRRFIYGPFRGKFGRKTVDGRDTIVFHSSIAHFTLWNDPGILIINQFPYEVNLRFAGSDTLLLDNATTHHEGGFPSSLIADSNNWVTFYYYKNANNTGDSLSWSIDSTGRYLTGAYADSIGHLLYFNKTYQPTSIRFPVPVDSIYPCRWDHTTGKIYFTTQFDPSAPHSGTDRLIYTVEEGPDYPVPPIAVDTASYQYHTYTMELLPHEARFLVDGAVRQRFPDRLIPIRDKRYDYVTTAPRAPMNILPAEIDMDGNPADTSSGSVFYQEKRYFDANSATCQGCWTDSHGQHIASHIIDYVKVWDLPKGVRVPNFPR